MNQAPVRPVMTRPPIPKTLFAVLLPFLLLIESLSGAARAAADTPSAVDQKPFDTITVTAQGVSGTALGAFDDRWRAPPGASIDFTAPFHAGVVQAGLHLAAHEARGGDVPDFRESFLWLGWAYRRQLPRRIACAAGVQMGVSYMRFDDASTPRARNEETELGFGAGSRVTYAMSPRWSVVFTAEYRKVLTRRPIEHVLVGVGLSRTFTTPGWLMELLE